VNWTPTRTVSAGPERTGTGGALGWLSAPERISKIYEIEKNISKLYPVLKLYTTTMATSPLTLLKMSERAYL
jgi:hypothetical protein